MADDRTEQAQSRHTHTHTHRPGTAERPALSSEFETGADARSLTHRHGVIPRSVDHPDGLVSGRQTERFRAKPAAGVILARLEAKQKRGVARGARHRERA